MEWYAAQVMTGEEKAIAERIRAFGLAALVPLENRPVRSDGVWNGKEYVIFPGYVFIQMEYTADNYYRLKGIPGVVKLLSGTLSYLEAEWIRVLSGQKGVPLEPTLVQEKDGTITIVTGVLKQFESRVVKIDRRSRRATVRLTLGGEEKDIQLGIRLEEETEKETGR